ncbi:hypothetical protein [Streptomyces laurentii]|uniref:hypothetical protein n=1 Tax=Streptomyces laurentii TaxID=39478 RepID=UPI0033E7539F
MSASKKVGPPDMGGLDADLARMRRLRHEGDKPRPEGSGEPTGPGGPDADEGQEHKEPTLFEAEETRPPTKPVKPGRTRGGRRPPPAAADAIPTTVRFDTDEAAEIDLWILTLREEAGRRQLDKAEVFRELTRLAREHEPTHKALMRRLR